ncbi:MAG: class I SAM-dependent methyltransferase [Acidobacteriota bacterium]
MGNEGEGYGAFAYAFDEALGRRFFAALSPLLDELIARYPPSEKTHLDVACGTGLAVRYFRSKGYSSVGIDASVPMLRVARSRGGRLSAGDMRALPLRRTFSTITCLYDSLNHMLSAEDLTAAFVAVREVMSEESLFFFDVNHPDVYRTVWSLEDPYVSADGTHRLVMDTVYSSATRQATAHVSGWARVNGQRVEISEQRRQRCYNSREVRRCLRDAGLRPVELIDFDPFEEGGSRKVKLFFVVQKAK